MPWSATDPAKERVELILEWEKRWDAGEGVTNISELCRELGISRETAYVWRRRYRAAGHEREALQERSHRPHNIPNQIPVEVSDVIVAARKQRPTWGPPKLRAYLMTINPGVQFPSVSAIADFIHRNDLTRVRRLDDNAWSCRARARSRPPASTTRCGASTSRAGCGWATV